MTRKYKGHAIGVLRNTKESFDELQDYTNSTSADALINLMMDFFKKEKDITKQKIKDFNNRFQ